MTTAHKPQDKYKAVWLIFFMLGLGTLLPWNFFMTATMYFKSRLGPPQNNSVSLLEENGNLLGSTSPPPQASSFLDSIFNNVMTLCAMLPLLVFTCLNSFLHQRIPQALRILGSLVAILLMFALTAILVKVNLDPLPFFVLTMIKIVIINSFGAILQGSMFGLAGLLPASYTAPIMSGQGLAGTFAALAMICAIASGSQLEESAFGYFITACGVIVLSILCYLLLPRLKFYQYYQQAKMGLHGERETKMDLIRRGENSTKTAGGISKPSPQTTSYEKTSIIAILKKIWVLALSVCFVFTITIGVFPSVTAEVQSTIAGTSDWNKYFIPVSCFFIFNVFDWAGRSLTTVYMWPKQESQWKVPALVVARVVFVPLMMLCNVQPRNNLPVIFHHDAWFIVFMIFFAFSNGYLASLCMCFGPKKVSPSEAETAGAIMAFFLSLGLALGALLSFVFRAIV
ncbi:equilibrative nucleoside transporter 1 [Sarcophilus harrisii]|uniref:Solute carrier family 29 member 1 (Augustine blood group) n=1 Tax=Sarcophilus harrisii TaxID=9305 RepID=G3WYI5_SARHA|nr:equilibrative nucleoside transporter 1 [Sarcophilus harrisii]XP_031820627.1 equilibrative nucleoside transporter 1 [Sarcophilus harrisii]XP_031820628.1 equilibrative nucleoside transporter 1 [Sarcophilus harrisii]XP_031820629.1 equilibrative nucleoside transporter 1 [Sarcophilus harrisii]